MGELGKLLIESLTQQKTSNAGWHSSIGFCYICKGVDMTRLFEMKDKIKEELEAKASKLSPSLLPVEATIEGAKAMAFGTTKYARDDWRTNQAVTKQSIMDALERHLIALKQGESHAEDSGVHHLGHIIANAGILLARFEVKK